MDKVELLAEKVMGWREDKEILGHWITHEGRLKRKAGWNPYESIADAWMIINKLTLDQYYIKLEYSCGINSWKCGLFGFNTKGIAESSNPCEAICNAALKTLEG